MNDWINVALSAIGGVLTVAGVVIGYLYKELKKADGKLELADRELEESDRAILKELNEFRTHIVGAYALRSETSRMFDLLRLDIKDKAEDIKSFIEAKLGDRR